MVTTANTILSVPTLLAPTRLVPTLLVPKRLVPTLLVPTWIVMTTVLPHHNKCSTTFLVKYLHRCSAKDDGLYIMQEYICIYIYLNIYVFRRMSKYIL